MQHVTLKARTTTTDVEQGQFTAIISSWTPDREGDTIDRHAFDQSIEDWRSSGKSLPLLFEHSVIAIGSLDPDSMYTDERGLIADGEVDRDTREGKQVWKQVKRGSISFSIGFMATKSKPREDAEEGGELLVIDLIEVSAVSSPMHPGTLALDWKGTKRPETESPDYDSMTDAELKEASLAAIKGIDRKNNITIHSIPC